MMKSVFVLLGFVAVSQGLLRIPLMRGESARQQLEEKRLFEEYRKKFPYKPAAKFLCRTEQSVVPMTYDPDIIMQSSTAQLHQAGKEPFHISYNSGFAAGSTGYDTVKISDIYVEHQIFGLTETEAVFLGSVPWDGILGLAFPDMSFEGGTPLFYSMWNQNKILKNMFSMYLSSITINGNTVACSASCEAIVDSGTSVIIGSSEDINNINGWLGAVSDQYGTAVVSCSNTNLLPDVVFNINGYSFPLPPSAYVMKVCVLNKE